MALLKFCVPCLMIVMCFHEVKAQKKWIDDKAAPIESINHIILPFLDNSFLKDKYKINDDEEGPVPNIFAEAITKQINCSENGTWESSVQGHLLWRQRITSKNAYSINLGFTDFFLPPSASLFIYDARKTYVIGPITQEDNDLHQEWWSPIIPSDDIVIELQIMPEDVPVLKLNLSRINHDFSGFGAVISGSCNLDVICSATDGFGIVDRFRDLINSVGMIMIQGRIQCTGTLVNNTRKDCTPYVITAEHCGITESTAASVVVFWNFQNSQCRLPGSLASGNPGDGEENRFNSGATLVAKYDQSDFSLVELDDSVDPDFNPYYAGWDNDTELVDTAFTIHHPAGGEKRISFDYDTLAFNIDRNFVQVADWDIGTTESGSSGAGIYNTSSRMVGHLSGGDASCGNDLFDDFGMFKKSWEGGGTPETRLKDWLDPLNTGQTTLDGRYCTDVAVINTNAISICTRFQSSDTLKLTAKAGYEDGGNIRVLEASDGLEVNFSAPTIGTGEVVDIYINVSNGFVGEVGHATFIVENDLGPTEFSITVNVFDNIPEVSSLIAPANMSSGLDFDVSFEWTNTAPFYELEISENPNFSGASRIIPELKINEVTLKDFLATTTYYWRVKSFNVCGESMTSQEFSFTTGTIICVTNNSVDLPKEISLEPVTITSTIAVDAKGTVSDINVLSVRGRHTWISDLSISLTSPSGTIVTLVETPCSDEDNFLVSFDDNSTNVNLDCPLTTGRSFKPVELLSAFNGEIAAGDWILTVEDGVSDDGGFLDAWILEICLNQTETKRFEIIPSFVEICDKDLKPVEINLLLNGGWNSPTNPMISTGSGMSIAATFSPDPIGNSQQLIVQIEDASVLIGENKVAISLLDGQEVITANIPVFHKSSVVKPQLNSPVNKADKQDLKPVLSWTSGLSQDGAHRIVLALDEKMESVFLDSIIPESKYSVTSELQQLTTYYWQVTAIGTCTDSSSTVFSFTTDMKVATIDETLSTIKIYPSPVSDILTIDLNELGYGEALSFQLLTIDGRVLVRDQITSQITNIDVGSFSSGLYFVNFISKKGNYIEKIIVHR